MFLELPDAELYPDYYAGAIAVKVGFGASSLQKKKAPKPLRESDMSG
jgi:hypothetical protein